jgi:hypothetical protein
MPVVEVACRIIACNFVANVAIIVVNRASGALSF